MCRADCDGNETVNILDALAVANVAIGILSECPGGGACKPIVTPETIEFMRSLRSYLLAEDFAAFMALVRSEAGIPTEYSLAQNYPNPFNPMTRINFQIPNSKSQSPIHTTLKVYNILGQEVEVLVDGQVEAGYHTV